MDPLTLGIGAIGLGMQLFGRMSASSHAKEMASLERQQAEQEMALNAQRRQQMELNGRRSLLEIYRNTQRLRSQSLTVGVSQNAQFGSGAQQGIAQVQAQGNYNEHNLSQNLTIGRNIFGINDQISQIKMQQASLRSSMAEDQGWASLGGSILQNAATIGKVGMSLYNQATYNTNPYSTMPQANIDF